MSRVVKFREPKGPLGFLSNFFPSPFVLGEMPRYRTAQHYFSSHQVRDRDQQKEILRAPFPSSAVEKAAEYPLRDDWEEAVDAPDVQEALGVPIVRTKDMVMLEALRAKFRQNPDLATSLRNTAPRPIDADIDDTYWGARDEGRNMLGRLLVYVRDNVLPSAAPREQEVTNSIFTNLYGLLRERGYTVPVDAPRTDMQGVEFEGKDGAFVDVYLQAPYPEARLKDVIKQREDKKAKFTYFIVGTLEKSSLSSILTKVANYNNIEYFSPSELIAQATSHTKNPRVRILQEDSEEYSQATSLSMAELDANNRIARQMGLRRGQIIEVQDFSPHYRRVV